MLEDGLADVVAVEPPAFARVGWRKRGAIGAVEQTPQQRRRFGAGSGRACAGFA